MSSPRVTLIGAGGQLATDLLRALPACIPLAHAEIEITDPASIERVLGPLRPSVVINTAAYNLVDKAEDEPAAAQAVNADGPANLARFCQRHGALLVHVSTDYVFGADSSRNIPYTETDQPGPLGVYGASKLAGERVVQSECDQHLVIRTCGLYGTAATKSKGNFVKTMLRLGAERPEVRVVNDQYCTPSSTADVAEMIAALIGAGSTGLFHVTNSGATTWFDVAAEAFRLKGLSTPVIPIPSSQYPTNANRPEYSVLDCSKAQAATGRIMPTWQDALARFVASLD